MSKLQTFSSRRGQKLLRRIDAWLGIPICMFLGFLHSKRALPSRIDCIGIIVFGAIGDALLASSVLDSLRRAYPEATLILFVSRTNRGVSDLIVGCDEIYTVPITRPHRAISLLRKARMDLLIDTTQWARISAVLSFFSNAACTIGFETPGQYRHKPYDLTVFHSNDRHELENFRALAEKAGGASGGVPILAPVAAFNAGLYGVHRPFIVFHPWAAGFKSYLREWADGNWRALAAALIEMGFDIVITGGKEDVDRALKMRALLASDHVVSLAGQLSLAELAGCLAEAKMVVSVNTGVMHLASLHNVSVISLNGPTNALRWGGIGANTYNINVEKKDGGAFLNLGFEYPKKDNDIMKKISWTTVFQMIQEILKPLSKSTA